MPRLAVPVFGVVGRSEAAFWFEGVPVHGHGLTVAAAVDDFVDALADYADDWAAGLHDAPNHAQHVALVEAVFACDGDHSRIRRLVFGI